MNDSRCRYRTVAENCYHPDLKEYHTYGIQVTTPTGSETLHDVSTSRRTVEYLVSLFNSNNLSPIHLYDAILDMIP